jgi:hypothetical protein
VSDWLFLAGAAWLRVAVPVLLNSVCFLLSDRPLLLVKRACLMVLVKRARLLLAGVSRALAGWLLAG